MITYRWQCANPLCEHEFELKRKMNDATTPHCPNCYSLTKKIPILNTNTAHFPNGTGTYKDLGSAKTQRNF